MYQMIVLLFTRHHLWDWNAAIEKDNSFSFCIFWFFHNPLMFWKLLIFSSSFLFKSFCHWRNTCMSALCCEIFSACLSVHVFHLSCFSIFLTSLSSSLFLLQCFPFCYQVICCHLSPFYINLFLWQVDIKGLFALIQSRNTELICTFVLFSSW